MSNELTHIHHWRSDVLCVDLDFRVHIFFHPGRGFRGPCPVHQNYEQRRGVVVVTAVKLLKCRPTKSCTPRVVHKRGVIHKKKCLLPAPMVNNNDKKKKLNTAVQCPLVCRPLTGRALRTHGHIMQSSSLLCFFTERQRRQRRWRQTTSVGERTVISLFMSSRPRPYVCQTYQTTN